MKAKAFFTKHYFYVLVVLFGLSIFAVTMQTQRDTTGPSSQKICNEESVNTSNTDDQVNYANANTVLNVASKSIPAAKSILIKSVVSIVY